MKTKKELAEYQREWHQNHREKWVKYHRDYYLNHRDKELARTKAWRLAHKEQWTQIQHKSHQKYKVQAKEYRQVHINHIRFTAKERRRIVRIEVLSHYSSGELKCAQCGFDDIRALQIDHIYGGGTKHRRELGMLAGDKFYRWLRRNNYPKEYQVLCANCNWIKRTKNNELKIATYVPD